MVYSDVHPEYKPDAIPFLEKELQSGELMMLNDRELWHNARDVWANREGKPAHGDWFILCAKK